MPMGRQAHPGHKGAPQCPAARTAMPATHLSHPNQPTNSPATNTPLCPRLRRHSHAGPPPAHSSSGGALQTLVPLGC
eukprot:6911688-Prymnesium_polylepis.2